VRYRRNNACSAVGRRGHDASARHSAGPFFPTDCLPLLF
jgi:hypothetical protein